MSYPSGPQRATRFHDPIAVGLGNASLLGLGYALIGHWGRVFVTSAITVVLLVVIGITDGAGWWMQGLLALWWVGSIAHGWFFARSRATDVGGTQHDVRPEAAQSDPTQPQSDPAQPDLTRSETAPPDSPYVPPGNPAPASDSQPYSAARQRWTAVAMALPMLLVFGLLRVDGLRIERSADEAHLAGECARALSRLDSIWFGHRLANAPLTERTDAAVEACELLRRSQRQAGSDRLAAEETLRRYDAHPAARWEGVTGMRADLLLDEAGDNLEHALTGNLDALDAGLDELGRVLDEIPRRAEDADRVLTTFLEQLPTENACETVRITGRLDDRIDRGDQLDQTLDTVGRTEPPAFVDCGDDLFEHGQPQQAKGHYEQLLSKYPEHEEASAAKRGVVRATQEIELRNVRQLLQVTYSNERPRYCKEPAPYSGAKPYRGGGPHKTLLYGKDGHASKLPAAWKADGPAEAVLIICAGSTKHGTVVETCPYTSEGSPYFPSDVSFHMKRIPLKVYEVRTGKVVRDTSIEIDGESCPDTIWYEAFSDLAPPPSDMYVTSDRGDIQDAYGTVIDP